MNTMVIILAENIDDNLGKPTSPDPRARFNICAWRFDLMVMMVDHEYNGHDIG